MRDITAEIARYLGERGPIAAFADALPDEPDEAAGVFEVSEKGAANGAPGFYPRAIQIRVRASGRAKAFEYTKRAFALLSSGPEEAPVLLSGGAALLIPRQTPTLDERDARERAIFFWNITVVV